MRRAVRPTQPLAGLVVVSIIVLLGWSASGQANPTLCPSGPVPDIASCTPDRG